MPRSYKVDGEWRLVLSADELRAVRLAGQVCCWVSVNVKPKGQFLIAVDQLESLALGSDVWVEGDERVQGEA